jgi:hypothetical protein
MADSKDNESFFRKVVRFVAHPTTDWTDLNSRQEGGAELELEKSELKAMVERKRRNDFVRKREFDTLRRIRREGLTPEQLAALGTSSKLDDSEARVSEGQLGGNSNPQRSVKAKIDHIEREMVGDSSYHSGSKAAAAQRPPSFFEAATEPASLAPPAAAGGPNSGHGGLRAEAQAIDLDRLPALPPLPNVDFHADAAGPAAPAPPAKAGSGLGPLSPVSLRASQSPGRFGHALEVEVSEIVHDPDLDEAVIAFANADFSTCEKSLQRLTSQGGERARHAETWLVLFDLYRATGQQPRFESLALDYAQQFGWSAPQWFSLPKLVADAVAEERPTPVRVAGDVGWICPETLDTDAVARLRSQTLQMPLPWVFDWSALKSVDAEAATGLSGLFRVWGGQMLEMQWIHGDRLFNVLADAAPTGVRDADPAFWLARMDALRLANRVDQFDETAIDYCVTYEVSPPSWEPTRCNVRIGGSGLSTRTPPLSMISEVSTSFLESGLADDAGHAVQVSTVELAGQLLGDIGATLNKLNNELGTAPVVNVSCARLIRVDFPAAGDLLNWVLAKRSENRTVQFVEAHRLVALFFGAMGINEHAKVQVRKV